MPSFKHFDLSLLNPSFDSPLVDVLNELEHLRRLRLEGTTPYPVFFELKTLFHMLESLGSARIEGNHTTLADYVDSKVQGAAQPGEQLREVTNIEEAMTYIDKAVAEKTPITEILIRELHAITVEQLTEEGDRTPGAYREGGVVIAASEHLPPDAVQVSAYMEELVGFINKDDPPKYDLMKVALAHHRFGWIHPFRNGNGRVVRLLTYALLIKYGFEVSMAGRILNPTAVFCNDRDLYYRMLGVADTGTQEGLERWCTYVLTGVLDELRKVDQLTDYGFLKERILYPALNHAKDRQLITALERNILSLAVQNGVVKSSDLVPAMPKLKAGQRTYQIRRLVNSGMLRPIAENARQYTVGFTNNYLIRGVIQALADEGYIPSTLSGPT